ncbi:unnamed protein product [Rhizophagus irregularis]|uniref:Uncharacterized protein n=1 Tax=Rhizophagus irregularis TaxID=588596 RepID=A0A2I1FVG7_9GLOM|nr:hypothetical protein RhiirA4_391760 [Rhizophagus irregularis]CAB4436378.1 unnamed protein product [Rhizophagus irregularis]
MFFGINSDFIKIIAALALVGTVLYYRNRRRIDREKKKPPEPKDKLTETNESTIIDTSSKEKEEIPLIQDSSNVDIPNESEENSKWVIVDFDDEQA